MVGELDDAFGSKKQLSATNRKKASQATGLIDDAADAPRPRTNALPDVEVAPSRGAVKNAAGGLADAGVGTGNVGRKNNTTTALSKDKLKSAKKSSPSLSKNQQKMQSQTVGSTLSEEPIQKNSKNINKTRDIYRTVDVEEYEDIMSIHKFRGIEGKTLAAKEFGNDFNETLEFANNSINKDKVAIIKVTIPQNIYEQLHHMNLDAFIFKSGTPVVEPDMLDSFNKSIIKIEHFY